MLTPDEYSETISVVGAPALTAERAGKLLRVTGDLDLWAADSFGALLDDTASEPVVVDLSEVAFLDSVGVRALLQAVMNETVTGYVNASEPVRRVLEVSGLAAELLLDHRQPA